MQQKCTLDELINILNSITRAFGYGSVVSITVSNGKIIYNRD